MLSYNMNLLFYLPPNEVASNLFSSFFVFRAFHLLVNIYSIVYHFQIKFSFVFNPFFSWTPDS